MKIEDLFLKRQSCRKYSDKEIEKEKLLMCVEAARLAPSACNSQPWTFIIVDSPDIKEKVAKETYDVFVSINKWIHQAPVIIAIVVENANFTSQVGGRIKNKDYRLFDIGIAAEHICLQATALGLGSCIIGWYNEKKIKKILNIPDRKSLGLLLALGYPSDEKIRDKSRKEIKEILRWNTY